MSREALVARFRLWHVLVVFVALAAWLSATVPLGEGPDELPHFTVTRYIVSQRRLPDTPEEHEAFQPPLYYLLGALLTGWIDTRDFVVKVNADYDPFAPDAPKMLLLHTRLEDFPYQGWSLAWHLMRGLSILMGVLTIGALYATALSLTGDRSLALQCAALLGFLPGFIFMSSLVNNDNLSAMFAALLCWRMAKLLRGAGRPATTRALEREPSALREWLTIGLLLGLGLLSKTSMLAFVATIFVALLAAARLQRWSLRAWLSANAVVFGVAAAVGGWYYARNALLYGDALAWPLVLAANAVRTQVLSLSDWLNAVAGVYRSFWLAWLGIALDELMYWIGGVFVLLAVIGAGLSVLRRLVQSQRGAASVAARPSPLVPPASPVVFLILALHFAIIFASWLRWTQTVLGTEQARLFYPALVSIVLFLVLGLRALHPRLPWALAALLLVLAGLTPLRYVAPTYAPAPRVAALPARVQPISATFKDKLRLIGWNLPSAQLHAGETLHLALYWEALQDLTDDDWLKIQMLDANDQARVFKDGSPSAGRDSTDSWRRGEIIASWHRLEVPGELPPGVYRLTVGVHPFGRKNWFPIAEENMPIAQGDQLILAEVTVE